MITVPSSITAVRHDPRHSPIEGEDLAITGLHEENTALRAELDDVQQVISAALLVVTAFRLRDQDGLMSALRLLARTVAALERRRACN